MYFAEGTTRNGFEEYLLLRNPGTTRSVVTVKYMFPSEAAKSQGLVLTGGAGTSINVNSAVGPGKDVSIYVTANPGVTAEREVYFNYKGVWTGGHATCGVQAPSDTWYFAEGTTRAGFQEWLCLQNPAAGDVTATLTYMLPTAENRQEQVTVPANSRKTVDVNASVGPEQDVSIKVEAGAPIVAERPMYFDYKGAWRGGHTATGAAQLATEWNFAEGTTRNGFEEWLCIVNPGDQATARVEYMFSGEPSMVREYTLINHGRTTIFVNEAVGPEKDVSIKVTCTGKILCERPMYFDYHLAWEGGHDVLGSNSGQKTWYFPTAGVGPGFESWLCLMNPDAGTNAVRVEVFGDGNGYRELEQNMAPGSRATIDLTSASTDITNPWIRVTGTRELIAERPTYFSYEPRVEPEPFAFAAWNGIELMSPIRYCDNIGASFHEATARGDSGAPSNAQAMQPLGICLSDDNPFRLAPGLSLSDGSEICYFIESTRARGTYSTTACDVHGKAGTIVYAPVSGTVTGAGSYLLYGKYPDLFVNIAIDGRPGYYVALLHMSRILVSSGQRTEAGRTPIGVVRDLVPYFNSGPDVYTREEGNHTHMQINYSSSSGAGVSPPEPAE
jgi:Peptidase family M23